MSACCFAVEADNSQKSPGDSTGIAIPKLYTAPDSIINYGKLFLNTPYRYGSPGSDTFDCSGFTSFVYRNFGYNLQRSSADQAEQFPRVDKTNLQPGDLVFFEGRRHNGRVGHVGMVVAARENGEFDFIHASTQHGVIISNSQEPYYLKRYVKAGRVISGDTTGRISGTIPQLKRQEYVSVVPTEKVKRIIPAVYHKVKKGENLSVIADKYHMSVNELKKLNHLKNTDLHPNDRLLIKPEDSYIEIVKVVNKPAEVVVATAEKKDSVITTNSVLPELHKVKSGETLTSISKLYNISVDELKKQNDLKNGKIMVGQQLKIQPVQKVDIKDANDKVLATVEVTTPNSVNKPVVAENSVSEEKPLKHKVKNGESLFSIATKYKITVNELKELNQLSGDKVLIGQELVVGKEKNEVVKPAESDKNSPKTGRAFSIHTVKNGESLYSLSLQYNVTIDDIKELNNLSSNGLQIDQKLKIPVRGSGGKSGHANEITHVVKNGESLYSIAHKYDCSMDDLKRWNNLSRDQLNIGDKLKIRK